MPRKSVMLIISSAVALSSAICFSATIRPTIATGLMQQPSSQYYHLIYGGQLDIAKVDDAAQLRLQYLERPPFRKAGYVDQDFLAGIYFGKSVIRGRFFGASAFIGGGYAWGYIKEDTENSPAKETYKLPGLGTALEARWTIKALDIRGSYQVLICQNSRSQLEAYVAWPFSWFLLTASMPVSVGG